MIAATAETTSRHEAARMGIPAMVRLRLSALPVIGEPPSDQKADSALRSAEASLRRGFRQGAETAHLRAAAICESRPMALRIAVSAVQHGFTTAAESAYQRAVGLSATVPDARFVLQAAQGQGFTAVIADGFARIIVLAQTTDEAIQAAEGALLAGLPAVANHAFARAVVLSVHPHEIRNVVTCAARHGVTLALPTGV